MKKRLNKICFHCRIYFIPIDIRKWDTFPKMINMRDNNMNKLKFNLQIKN